MKWFFSVYIFIVKQSMMLTFLRLFWIVSSSDWKHKKKGLQGLPTNLLESWLWAFSLILRKLWSKSNWTFPYAALQNLAYWPRKIMRIFSKNSFHYQTAQFCRHKTFSVKTLAWKKSGCNRLTNMGCKWRFYYILAMKTFLKRVILLRDVLFNWVVVCIRVSTTSPRPVNDMGL